MPPRFAIERLPGDQYQFVIDAVIAGCTNREICDAFEKQFGAPLAKSSLGRWRETAGQDLVQQYRLARFQATQLLERLEQTHADKFDLVMAGVEDRLLTAMRQISSADPLKLLALRQKEGGRRLRQRMVELKEMKLGIKEERALKLESLQRDRLAIGAESWCFVLRWLLYKEPQAVDVLVKRSDELIPALGDFLEGRFPL
jgi:hypothetical protein